MSHSDGCSVFPEQEKTRCERHRDDARAAASGFLSSFWSRPAVGQYVPQCDEHGAYEPTQCHTGIEQCWCVDAGGQEIPNTRTGPGSTPLCESHDHTPLLCLFSWEMNSALRRRYRPHGNSGAGGPDPAGRRAARRSGNTPAVCSEREDRTRPTGRTQHENGRGQTSAAHPGETTLASFSSDHQRHG